MEEERVMQTNCKSSFQNLNCIKQFNQKCARRDSSLKTTRALFGMSLHGQDLECRHVSGQNVGKRGLRNLLPPQLLPQSVGISENGCVKVDRGE